MVLLNSSEHNIPSNEQQLHRLIVGESYQTYLTLKAQGFNITPNPLILEKRFVGNVKKVYPDIVVWRPYSPESQEGTTVLIEQIETAGSINGNVNTWRDLASTGIYFVLVVPAEQIEHTRDLLRTNSISVNKIQTWVYDNETNQFSFTDIN